MAVGVGSEAERFAGRVRAGFSRRAAAYEREARLQRGVAARLARHCRPLPLPPGPCADLGSGTGLLGRAIERERPELSLLRLDACGALLEQGAAGGRPRLLWDLNRGLPPALGGAALLASSFALHWLERPAAQLEHWCSRLAAGGWLVLAVPTAASFPQWHRAAAAAGVPCTALPLPAAADLVAVAERWLELRQARRLTFSVGAASGLALLGRIRAIGAGASPAAPLGPGQWRRLEAHWPAEAGDGGKRLSWEVLLLIGRRPPGFANLAPPLPPPPR
jgi:malonyl-CoA O-methyltransferase